MKTNYHYIIGRHQIDLTKIAIQEPRIISDQPNLIMHTSPSRHDAFYFGYSYDTTFSGPAGLLYYKVSDLAVSIKDNGAEAQVIFSPNDVNYTENMSELLDRVKVKLSNYPVVYVISHIKNFANTSPH